MPEDLYKFDAAKVVDMILLEIDLIGPEHYGYRKLWGS